MSKHGLKIAQDYAQTLPRFENSNEAERALFERRDHLLSRLRDTTREDEKVQLDGSKQSLKDLEQWYFAVLEGPGFASVRMDREEVEHAISMYLGEVLVRNANGFRWVVEKFAFAEGCYEVGVATSQVKIMLSRGANLQAKPNNSRRQSLYREFSQFAAYAADST
jgi:hypothetical protein